MFLVPIPASALVTKPKVEGLLICLCVVVQKSVEMNHPLPEHAILSVGGVCEPVEKIRSLVVPIMIVNPWKL
jgi:hypothetical protein